MRRTFGVIACVCAAVLAAPPAVGAAGPEPIAPADGATFLVGAPVDFSVSDSTPGKSVFVHISKSPVLDADGLIADDVWIRGMTGGPVFTARWEYSGLQQPGTYFWQAHRIDCSTPSYPDCRIEGPVRSFTVTGPTARLSLAGACYRENVPLVVGGSGFTPGAPVELRLGGRTFQATAGPGGALSATVKAPDVLTALPRQDEYELTAAEASNPANAAKLSVRVTSLGLSVSPSAFVRTGQRVRHSFSGFPNGRAIYAHYRWGGATRGTSRLGVAKAPCGTLATRAEMVPRRIIRAGAWTVQFDARRAYSPRATPRLRRSIHISVVRLSGGLRRPADSG